jgi:hypothetical protein
MPNTPLAAKMDAVSAKMSIIQAIGGFGRQDPISPLQ